jgi:hypothetical protein
MSSPAQAHYWVGESSFVSSPYVLSAAMVMRMVKMMRGMMRRHQQQDEDLFSLSMGSRRTIPSRPLEDDERRVWT